MTREGIPLSFLHELLRENDLISKAGLAVVQRVPGGSINNTYRLSADNSNFFIKVNDHSHFPDMFEMERAGLESLRRSNSFRMPKVFSVSHYNDRAILLMEFIEEGESSGGFWPEFADRLARLHRNSNEQFGYPYDNYIGSLRQSNQQDASWPKFFIEQRLEPQIRLAEKLLTAADRQLFNRLFNRLEELIPVEPPALVHGDLWGGNYLADQKGAPVLIDPAVYYGHREMDLAMMQLFGGFSEEVFQYYQQFYPLQAGWRERLDLHNLYPLMVHANLFGASYLQSVRSNLKRFL